MPRMLETTIKLPAKAIHLGKKKARLSGHESLSRYIRDLVLVDLGLQKTGPGAGNGKR